MAFYAVEACAIPARSVASFVSAAADSLVCAHASMRSPVMALVAAGASGIHPKAFAFQASAKLLRRMWHLMPEYRESLDLILAHYAQDPDQPKAWGLLASSSSLLDGLGPP